MNLEKAVNHSEHASQGEKQECAEQKCLHQWVIRVENRTGTARCAHTKFLAVLTGIKAVIPISYSAINGFQFKWRYKG
jgi:hypothetical protein